MQKNNSIYKLELVLALALILLATPATAPSSAVTIPTLANIQVSVLNTNPQTLEPGKDVLLTLKVENYGSEAADNVTVTFKPRYPFELKPGESAMTEVGRLGPLREAYIEYDLLVREDAVEGLYTVVTDTCMESCEKGRSSSELDIRVNAAPNVLVTATHVPELIGSDMDVPVRITVENVGSGRARKVQVEFSTVPSGSTDASLFTLVDSAQVAFLSDMAPRSLRHIDVTYRTGAHADGIYKLPVTITYSDGDDVEKDFTVTIDVNAQPDITIGQISVNPPRILPGSVVSATIPFTNTGDWEAEDLKIVLSTIPIGATGQTTPFGLVDGTAQRTYDIIAANASDTAKFSLLVDPDATGVYTLKAYLTYKGLATPMEGVISVPVFGEPRLEAAVRGVSQENGNLQLSVDVMNSGSGTANAIVVELSPKDDDVKLVSSPRSLLGSLAPNEIQTVDFTLKIPQPEPAFTRTGGHGEDPDGTPTPTPEPVKRTFTADVSLHYKNAMNQDLSEPTELSFSEPQRQSSGMASAHGAGGMSQNLQYGMYALTLIGALTIVRWLFGKLFGGGD